MFQIKHTQKNWEKNALRGFLKVMSSVCEPETGSPTFLKGARAGAGAGKKDTGFPTLVIRVQNI